MHRDSTRPTNVRWAIFALACGTSWMMYLHRYVFALIKPQLVEQWHLGKEQLGLLDSAFSLCYSVFQFPLGVAADLVGVRIVLTGLIVLWCVGLGMHAWAPSPRYLWLARVTLGIGQSAVYATLSRTARAWFPLSIRTTLQGIVGILAGRVGGLSAYLLFGTVLLGMLHLDWRTATYWAAGAGLVYALLFFVLFRNTPRQHPWTNEAEDQLIEGMPAAEIAVDPSAAPQPRLTVGQMLRQVRPRALANMICLNVQTILSTFADNIFSNWIPLFLWEVHKLEFKEMGIYSSLPLLGGAIAGLVGGLLNDWLIAATGSRRWSRSGVAACGKGLAAAALFAALA